MPAIILKSEFYDDYGLPWTINIWDKEADTFVGEIAYTPKGSIILTDEGDDNDPFKRIIPKKLAWTILMHAHDYTTEQREAIFSFYSGLTTSPEGRYYVELIQDTKRIFRGKILADVGDLTLSYHRELALTATDGLLQLKDVPYRPTDYDDKVPETLIKKLTFIEHFTEILSRNDVIDFFYNSGLFLGDIPMFTTSANWKYLYYDVFPAHDIFTRVSMANTYFKQDEGKAYREYDSCYNALQDLITGPNMRMYFANGAYHIEQLGYQDNLVVKRYVYDYSGAEIDVYTNKTTHNITTNDDIIVLADPAIKHISPFKAITLKQNKKYNNLLGGTDIFWHYTDPDNRGPHNLGYQLSGGNQFLFDLRLDLSGFGDFGLITNEYYEFEFQIQIGDYYLSNAPDELYADQFGISLLSTITPSTFKVRVDTNAFTIIYKNFKTHAIIGISDTLPEDGEVIFTFIDWTYKTKNDIYPPDPILFQAIVLKQSRFYLVTNGIEALTTVPDDTIIYEIGDVKNSIVYETKLSYFDSNELETRFNNIWIYTLTSFGSRYYTHSIEWTDDDMGVTLPIQELMMRQILGMRKVPGKVIRLTMLHEDGVLFHMDNRYAIGEDLYIPIRMVHNIDQGVYQLSLWSPIKDYDGVNIIKFGDDIPTEIEVLVEDLIYNTVTSANITAYWRFDNVNDPFVEIEESLNFFITSTTEPDNIEANFDVFKNGVRLDYVDYTTLTFPLVGGEMTMAQYTVEVDADKFHFAFNEGDTIIIKYFKK